MTPDSEGLQYAPPEPGLEHNGPRVPDSAHRTITDIKYGRGWAADASYVPRDLIEVEGSTEPTNDYRRRKIWITTVVLGLIILSAAIGGGVGGSIAQRGGSTTTITIIRSSISQATAPITALSTTLTITSTSIQAPHTTTTTEPPSSVATIVGPLATLYRDCPSSNGTVFTADAVGPSSQQYLKACNIEYGYPGSNGNGENYIQTFVSSLDSCINLCTAWNVDGNGTLPPCNSVCWRNSFNIDYAGYCFGFSLQKLSNGSWPINRAMECDTAVWINELGH